MAKLKAEKNIPGGMLGVRHRTERDTIFEAGEDVAQRLVSIGYAERLDAHPAEQRETQSLSVDDLERKGSWYVLPSGEKVQGKEEAEEALESL